VSEGSIFTAPGRRVRTAPMTFREAVLGSLLAHALVFIAILLAPKGLLRAPLFLKSAEDEPVHMTFVQDRPRPALPNSAARDASDRDRRRAQEEPAPRAAKIEPFSRGNTPARIAEGLQNRPGPPPGMPAPPPVEAQEKQESPRASGEIEAKTGTGPLYVPPRGEIGSGEDDPALKEKAARLKDALAQMGAAGAGSGGSKYRYDNPTGGLATPAGSLSFDTKGFDWGPYSRRIYWIIWSNWHDRMPPALYAGMKGQVTVHFVIHRDGRITDIEILSPSGIPAYDNAATLALEASSPLPPLPDDFPRESDGVTGRFLYNIWEEGE
jgi:TonB family protein